MANQVHHFEWEKAKEKINQSGAVILRDPLAFIWWT